MIDVQGFITWVLSQDWFRGAVLFLGTIGAFISISNARMLARRKQTCDALFACRNDAAYKAGLAFVSQCHDAEDTHVRVYAKKVKNGSDEQKHILYVLNHFEYVSIGIQHGIYDEKMFKDAQCGSVVSLYEKAMPFIKDIREGADRPTLFQDFAWLGERWTKRPLKKKTKRWWWPLF